VVRLEGEVMMKLSESRVGDGVSGPSRNRVYRFYQRVYKLYANQVPSVKDMERVCHVRSDACGLVALVLLIRLPSFTATRHSPPSGNLAIYMLTLFFSLSHFVQSSRGILPEGS
jgi:hypothetical protein